MVQKSTLAIILTLIVIIAAEAQPPKKDSITVIGDVFYAHISYLYKWRNTIKELEFVKGEVGRANQYYAVVKQGLSTCQDTVSKYRDVVIPDKEELLRTSNTNLTKTETLLEKAKHKLTKTKVVLSGVTLAALVELYIIIKK